MIVLQNTNQPQSFNLIANVDQADLPIDGVVFQFTRNSTTINVEGSLIKDGFRQQTTITVDLSNEADYDLEVLREGQTIYKDTVFVTDQDINTYAVNRGDYTYFDTDADAPRFFIDGETIVDVDENVLTFPYTGGEMILEVNAVGDFTVGDNVDWLTFVASGSGVTSLAITADSNIGEFRTGTLQIVSGGITRNIRIDQEEKPIPGYIRNSPEAVGEVDQVLAVNTGRDGLEFTDLPDAIRGIFNVPVFRSVPSGDPEPANPGTTLYNPTLPFSNTNGVPTDWFDDEGTATAVNPTGDTYQTFSGIVDPNITNADGNVEIVWGVVHEISATGTPGATGPGYSSITDNGDGTITFNPVNGATTFTTPDLTGDDGAAGAAGAQGRMVFTIYMNSNTIPATPEDSSYVQDTGVLSQIPTGWSLIPEETSGTIRYGSQFTLNPRVTTDNVVAVDWGTPFVDGVPGVQGVGVSDFTLVGSIVEGQNAVYDVVFVNPDPNSSTVPTGVQITAPAGAMGSAGETGAQGAYVIRIYRVGTTGSAFTAPAATTFDLDNAPFVQGNAPTDWFASNQSTPLDTDVEWVSSGIVDPSTANADNEVTITWATPVIDTSGGGSGTAGVTQFDTATGEALNISWWIGLLTDYVDLTDIVKNSEILFFITDDQTPIGQSQGTTTSLADLGITASADEINVLDDMTATTAELNVLDGANITTDELSLLGGLTALENVSIAVPSNAVFTDTTYDGTDFLVTSTETIPVAAKESSEGADDSADEGKVAVVRADGEWSLSTDVAELTDTQLDQAGVRAFVPDTYILGAIDDELLDFFVRVDGTIGIIESENDVRNLTTTLGDATPGTRLTLGDALTAANVAAGDVLIFPTLANPQRGYLVEDVVSGAFTDVDTSVPAFPIGTGFILVKAGSYIEIQEPIQNNVPDATPRGGLAVSPDSGKIAVVDGEGDWVISDNTFTQAIDEEIIARGVSVFTAPTQASEIPASPGSGDRIYINSGTDLLQPFGPITRQPITAFSGNNQSVTMVWDGGAFYSADNPDFGEISRCTTSFDFSDFDQMIANSAGTDVTYVALETSAADQSTPTVPGTLMFVNEDGTLEFRLGTEANPGNSVWVHGDQRVNLLTPVQMFHPTLMTQATRIFTANTFYTFVVDQWIEE